MKTDINPQVRRWSERKQVEAWKVQAVIDGHAPKQVKEVTEKEQQDALDAIRAEFADMGIV